MADGHCLSTGLHKHPEVGKLYNAHTNNTIPALLTELLRATLHFSIALLAEWPTDRQTSFTVCSHVHTGIALGLQTDKHHSLYVVMYIQALHLAYRQTNIM